MPSSSGSFKQLAHETKLSVQDMTAAQFADRGMQAPRPVGIGMSPGDIESIFSTKEIGDHDERNPGFAAEERLEDCRVKIARIIRCFARKNEPGKLRNLGEIMRQLL